jgi:hypothetical protein
MWLKPETTTVQCHHINKLKGKEKKENFAGELGVSAKRIHSRENQGKLANREVRCHQKQIRRLRVRTPPLSTSWLSGAEIRTIFWETHPSHHCRTTQNYPQSCKRWGGLQQATKEDPCIQIQATVRQLSLPKVCHRLTSHYHTPWSKLPNLALVRQYSVNQPCSGISTNALFRKPK